MSVPSLCFFVPFVFVEFDVETRPKTGIMNEFDMVFAANIEIRGEDEDEDKEDEDKEDEDKDEDASEVEDDEDDEEVEEAFSG